MGLINYLTPINLASEKEKYFDSNNYHPVFKYNWNGQPDSDWAPNPKIKSLIEALYNQDFEEIRKTASILFETELSSELLNTAKKVVRTKPGVINHFTLDEVVYKFTNAFKYFELDDCSVEIADLHGFNFRPSYKNKKIIVSKYCNLDYFSIDGEVKHEMIHIIRSVNGEYNGIPKAENYLPTEEGLAAFCQDYAGEKGSSSYFQHAAEYAVTEVSLAGPLRDAVNYLTGIGFSKELAWQRASRHKFGFFDTSGPGDIMKPSMYFYQQKKILGLREEEIIRLFNGKISINQLDQFPNYSGKIPIKKLKEFYNWSDQPRD